MFTTKHTALLVAAATILASPALAQTYTMTWNTIDGGGAQTLTGGRFTLSGTAGQPDAGPTTGPMIGTASGISFALAGGYWAGFNRASACVADVDDGSFTGTPDGGVTIDDLLYYLFIFENGDLVADVDDGSSTGTPDGGVTIDDLLYYLFRFEQGC